jgi:hypothetical protein
MFQHDSSSVQDLARRRSESAVLLTSEPLTLICLIVRDLLRNVILISSEIIHSVKVRTDYVTCYITCVL